MSFQLQATRFNKPDVVKELLKAGANPNIRNNTYQTALLYGNYNESETRQRLTDLYYLSLYFIYFSAANNNFTDIAKLLIENEATDLNIRDNHGRIALMRGIR